MEELSVIAKDMLKNAYAPYSGFKVGCALVGKSGNIYRGCNIENVSFSVTGCAERVALFTAIAAGEHHFTRLVLTTSSDEFITPCGVCRQALSEWVEPSFQITLITQSNQKREMTFDQLLPNQFRSDQVGNQ